MRIGVAQIRNSFELSENVGALVSSLKKMRGMGADLVLFPECALTGYHTRIGGLDWQALRAAVTEVASVARELNLALALGTPWPEDGALFNSVLLISPAGEVIQSVHKGGLQKGEERFFSAAPPGSRTLRFGKIRIGVLLCVEAAAEPWEYLQNENLEFIYWPGFYACTAEEIALGPARRLEALEQNVRQNLVREWKVPLVHVNCASSPEAHHWPGRSFGGSALFDASGAEILTAKFGAEDYFVFEVGRAD